MMARWLDSTSAPALVKRAYGFMRDNPKNTSGRAAAL
jgi:hypothetical protein